MKKNEIKDIYNSQSSLEVLGSLVKKPQLLTHYKISRLDFPVKLHELIFKAIEQLYADGAKIIDLPTIDEYLSQFETQYAYYVKKKGPELLTKAIRLANVDNIEYHVNTLKKYSLLRGLAEQGTDISEFYDNELTDFTMIESIQEKLQETSLLDIINHFKNKQLQVFNRFAFNGDMEIKRAGEGAREQKEKWKKEVSWGLGYSSAYLTTALHGSRQRKYVVKSAGSGTGKTRTAIADLCHAFVPRYYDKKTKSWCKNPNGNNNRCLYIGTEMELTEEIEPILWAYIADVPQEHIQFNEYEDDEEARVDEAIKILEEEANIWLAYTPEYDVETLEGIIQSHKINHQITHVFFDYIHITPDLISEYSSSTSSRMSLREDQVLANLSKKLKNMTAKYNVAIETCTQVSGDYKNESNRDETIVRGAKAIIDKADSAMIASRPTVAELKKIETIMRNNISKAKEPNLVYSIYKNRGGKHNKVKIWLYVDYDTMRVHDLFVTDYEYKLLPDFPKSYINVYSKTGVMINKGDVFPLKAQLDNNNETEANFIEQEDSKTQEQYDQVYNEIQEIEDIDY